MRARVCESECERTCSTRSAVHVHVLPSDLHTTHPHTESLHPHRRARAAQETFRECTLTTARAIHNRERVQESSREFKRVQEREFKREREFKSSRVQERMWSAVRLQLRLHPILWTTSARSYCARPTQTCSSDVNKADASVCSFFVGSTLCVESSPRKLIR
jgi:hypothetical protein